MRLRGAGISCFGVVASVIAFAAIAPQGANATFAGGNGYIYFQAHPQDGPNSPHVWRVRPDGKGLLDLTARNEEPSNATMPSVAIDAKRVAFDNGASGFLGLSEIWTTNAVGASQRQLTFGLGGPRDRDLEPAISPGGQRIVFKTSRDSAIDAQVPDYNLWAMDANGENPVALVDTPGVDSQPEFTPDGEAIFYAYEPTDTDADIVRIGSAPPEGGGTWGLTPIVDGEEWDTDPTAHPSSQRIAFERSAGIAGGDIYSTNSQGGDLQPIATGADNQTDPAYSPDGEKIVFSSSVSGGRLIVADADGSNAAPLPLNYERVNATTTVAPAWEADTRAPTVKITKKPKKRSSKRSATFRFKANEAGSTFRCKLDRKPLRPCGAKKSYRVKPGKHRFQVRATDFAGNRGKPAKYAFRVTR